MSLCRACGQDHTLNGAPFGSFQDHARIYFDLTAIQLHEYEDPNVLELCSDCVDKLNEFDRFRDVCLQVHYGLQVKNELQLDQPDVLKQEEEDNRQSNSTDEEEILGGEEPHELIEMDFRQLAIGDSDGLRKWSFILPTLVAHLSQPYQDDLSKAIAEHLNSSSPTQDSVICGVLMLLNHELQPTAVMRNFKPCVRTAQQDVILFGVTDEQVKAKLIEREAMYALYDIPIGPVLVFRGNDFRTLAGSYEVHYEDIVYRFDSAVRAIDVLVKFSTVFGLEYSKICRRVWLFICSFIYDLPVAEQYESIIKLKRLLAPCLPVC